MNKLVAFILILIIAPIIGGLYGILHDQLTYTIAPEYYTKFKFYQFGLATIGDEAWFPNPRIQVAIVGFMATWWMGIPIGIFLGLVGLFHKNGKALFSITLKALLLTVVIAFLTGLIGLAYGYFSLSHQPVEHFNRWYIPDNLENFESFICVGSMHNFSYLGGAIGLVVAIFFSFWQKFKRKK